MEMEDWFFLHCLQENGASVILRDIARARENIQKSLAGSSGPGASSRLRRDHNELVVFLIASLEVENQSLKGGEAPGLAGQGRSLRVPAV